MSGWLISDLRRGPRFVLCASDGTISSEFFKDREPPPPNKFKSIPVLGAKMQQTKTKLVNAQAENASSHVVLRNLKKSAGEEQAHLTAAIGRMASADAEVATMMESTMSVAPLESLLGPTEQVLAKLDCVGFDGFPDFGVSNEQQRIGKCSVALIGSEKDPHARTCQSAWSSLTGARNAPSRPTRTSTSCPSSPPRATRPPGPPRGSSRAALQRFTSPNS